MSDLFVQPHTVLVVDDEAVLRLDASEALQEAGCATYEACQAEEALRMLDDHPEISVLFTDVNMPGDRDGVALASAVHDLRPDVRVIITSGNARPAPTDIPDDGQFIAKPYDIDAVAAIITALPRRT